MSPTLSIDREALATFCRRHHIKRLALFGSALGATSVGIATSTHLVEFEPGHIPGLNFVAIERELSGLFSGRRVDLVPPKFLNARIRDQVMDTAELWYVAA